ncbi:DUF4190 domain-containing protein [Rothia sp. P7181]|uniref:DUF4190 domain-containing protein n=1 Tax=unclassified Rothia (in: high G+C Gram-positive bacteria) TaxID=2689056 RepID=UPI003AD479C5
MSENPYGNTPQPEQNPHNGYNNQAPQGGYQMPQPNAYAPMPGQKVPGEGMSLAALILGILGFLSGWLVIGGLLGLIALILGIMALRKLKPYPMAGRGKAIAGIILGVLSILAAIVMAFFWSVAINIGFEAAEHCKEYQDNPTQLEQCITDYTDSKSKGIEVEISNS